MDNRTKKVSWTLGKYGGEVREIPLSRGSAGSAIECEGWAALHSAETSPPYVLREIERVDDDASQRLAAVRTPRRSPFSKKAPAFVDDGLTEKERLGRIEAALAKANGTEAEGNDCEVISSAKANELLAGRARQTSKVSPEVRAVLERSQTAIEASKQEARARDDAIARAGLKKELAALAAQHPKGSAPAAKFTSRSITGARSDVEAAGNRLITAGRPRELPARRDNSSDADRVLTTEQSAAIKSRAPRP